uniref:Orf64 n=1 Tax=Phytophthora polonica TaxID=374175 RepID=A0A0Y0C277_9STRA|nr:orf64 [Phytophthora polonica]AMB20919.1 orf64 [Phytophthora polonica]
MNKNKKFFTYKNKIILTNGSSLKITSIKYIKNFQLNLKIFKETEIISKIDTNLNKNKLNFIKKLI